MADPRPESAVEGVPGEGPEPHFRSLEELARTFFPAGEMPRLDGPRLHRPGIETWFPGERNAHGYRADDFANRGDFSIAYLGCSWVEGTLVSRGDLFSDQVSQLLSARWGRDVKSWNCGLAGSGIDYVDRLLPRVCGVLRPDLVVVVLSTLDRREYFTADGRRRYFIDHMPVTMRDGRDRIEAVDFPVIDNLASLSNRFNDCAQLLRSFALWQVALEGLGIRLLFSCIDHPVVSGAVDELLRAGALPAANYLGHPFERIDRAAPDNGHPGPVSHRRFAEAIAGWVLRLRPEPPTERPGTESGREGHRATAPPHAGLLARWNWPRRLRLRYRRRRLQRDYPHDQIYPLW
jgi:hypothetical protein